MVGVVCADARLFAARIPFLSMHFVDRPCRLHLCRQSTLRAKVLEPGRVTMRPGARIGGIAMVSWTRVVSATVPGANARAQLLEAAHHEVLSVRKVGADESELHLGDRPESGSDISIWKIISRTFGLLREKRV